MTAYSDIIIKTTIGLVVILSAPALLAQINDAHITLASNVAVGAAPSGGAVPAMHNSLTQHSITGGVARRGIANRGLTNQIWVNENHYWHNHYSAMPYYNRTVPYSMYEPAYQYGVNIFDLNNGERWERLNQKTLRAGWEHMRGNSRLSWNQAQKAAHDAYIRMYKNKNHNDFGGTMLNYSPVGR